MELMGALVALQAIDSPAKVVVTTDSTYVANAFNKGWIKNWERVNWRTKTGLRTNTDIWKALVEEVNRHEQVGFKWVRGHNGHVENERVDELANSAAQQPGLDVDHGFEA